MMSEEVRQNGDEETYCLRTQVLGEEVREVAEIVVNVHAPPHTQGQLAVKTGEEE